MSAETPGGSGDHDTGRARPSDDVRRMTPSAASPVTHLSPLGMAAVEALRWKDLADAFPGVLGDEVEATLSDLGLRRADPLKGWLGPGWLCGLGRPDGVAAGLLHIEAPLAQALAGRALLGAAAPGLEVRPLLAVEDEALGLLVAHVLGRSGLGLTALPERASVELEAPPPHYQTVVQIAGPEAKGALSIFVRASAWPTGAPRALPSLAEPDTAGRPGNWLARRGRIGVALGGFSPSPEEVAELAVGDVLLPDQWLGQSYPERGWLCFADQPVALVGLDWSAELTARLIAPDGELAARSRGRASRASHLGGEPAGTASLELWVLGDRRPLASAVALRVGDRVSFGEAAALEIVVRPADRPDATVGRGELVSVEGRLGVRLTAVGQR